MATYRVPVLRDFNWQPNIKDKDLGTPPGGETKGDRYIVSANGGAWSDGAAKDIAWWDGTGWNFDTPSEGWQCWVEDENAYYVFDGNDWVVQDLATNTSDISSHTIQIASLENDVSSHTIQIASLENDVSSHVIQIASNESNISSHTIQIATNGGNISSHTIQVASLESKQVLDRASIDSVETMASANASNISSHTVQIASAQEEGTYVAEYGAIEFTI